MAVTIKVKRATRAQLDAAATADGLTAGEPYLITDEGNMALATGAGTYQTFVKADGVKAIKALTQAEYDALSPPVAGTLYVVSG